MKKMGFNNAMNIFGFFMAFIYIGVGVFILLAHNSNFDLILGAFKIPFCLFFIAYGIFRIIRSYYKYKNDKDYENTMD